MRSAFYNSPEYKSKQSDITQENWKLGKFKSLVKPLESRVCKNPSCNSGFQVKPHDPKIFCSQSCAAKVNNHIRPRNRKMRPLCLNCGSQTKRSSSKKYCSLKCQMGHSHKLFIDNWKLGLENGTKGISTKVMSEHVKRYLFKKYSGKCCKCGWNIKHSITGKVPLEVDHIDGNSDNNIESNLRLLCPNCHSLTPYFRNLNKGKGRGWRLKYLKTRSKSLHI